MKISPGSFDSDEETQSTFFIPDTESPRSRLFLTYYKNGAMDTFALDAVLGEIFVFFFIYLETFYLSSYLVPVV